MKYLLSILFLTLIQATILAQPAPCGGYAINILENIHCTSYDETDIQLKSIRFKPVNNWKDVIKKDTLNTEILELSELKMPNKYCNNLIYKSKIKNRFYYSYPLVGEIMIIHNGEKKMYLIFPEFNNVESNFFLKAPIDSLGKLNFVKDKKPYYYPNRYISNIEFREGVFFIKDYKEKFSAKSFERNDVLEFVSDNLFYDRNPENYWNEKVYFISPFDEKSGPEFEKAFYGNFTENQAIEIIVKNHPPIIKKILESSVIIINNKEYRTQHQEDLFEIWYSLLRRNLIDKEVALWQKYESDKSSINEVYKEYKEFQKTEFFSILKSDFDLTLKYYKYFIDENFDLKEFIDFAKVNELKFDKEQLEQFIDDKK